MKNLWIGIGRIGKDPELRHTSDGKAVCTFNLATNDFRAGKDTQWHSIVVWGKPAENCAQYLHKGSLVAVTASVRNRIWEDKEGNRKYKTEYSAHSVDFLDPKQDGQQKELPLDDKKGVSDDDDLPF